MKKKELLKRIEELEKRVAELENQPTNFVKNPAMDEWTGPGYITTEKHPENQPYWYVVNTTSDMRNRTHTP